MHETEELSKTAANLDWSPLKLRPPSSSGETGPLRFAFYAEKRRLLVQSAGELLLYDCGDHFISALRADTGSLKFTSQRGEHGISQLRRLN